MEVKEHFEVKSPPQMMGNDGPHSLKQKVVMTTKLISKANGDEDSSGLCHFCS